MLTYNEVLSILDSDQMVPGNQDINLAKQDKFPLADDYYDPSEIRLYNIFLFDEYNNTLYTHTGYLKIDDLKYVIQFDQAGDKEYALWFFEYSMKKEANREKNKHLVPCLVSKIDLPLSYIDMVIMA